MTRADLIAALGFLAAASPVLAQSAEANVFLWEKSYAARGTPTVLGAPGYYAAVAEPDLLAEAQLAVHLPLRRGLTLQEIREGPWKHREARLEGFGFNLFLTPQFRLRGLDVPSGPVKSISFMPKFTGQFLWAMGGDGFGGPGTRHISGINVILGHHSNGGATCVFEDESIQDNECVSSLNAIPPANQRVTQVNGGNFSTNYIELGGGYRVGRTDDRGGERWIWFAEAGLSYQRHHRWFGLPLPGGPVEGFDDLYGLHRVRFDHSGFAEFPGRARWLGLRWGLRYDRFSPELARFPGSRNYTLQSEVFLQTLDRQGWRGLPEFLGLGVRYSRGMDYYNTQFIRDISALQLLVVVDPWTSRLSG